MRWNRNVAMVVGLAVVFAAGVAAGAVATMNVKTRANVLEAMHGESFAHAKYLRYAQQARARGDIQVAELFESTAMVELHEHFMEEADLIGFGGTDVENLTDAIQGENYETTTMYPMFAKQAAAAGEYKVAQKLLEIAQDEAAHRDAFQAMLDQLLQLQQPGSPQ